MSDAAELALAEDAVRHGVRTTGCCEWDDEAAERVRSDPSLQGLTPEYIRDRLCRFIAVEGGRLQQVRESRPEYSLPHLLVQGGDSRNPVCGTESSWSLKLTETDPDLPGVTIFNAHPQRR